MMLSGHWEHYGKGLAHRLAQECSSVEAEFLSDQIQGHYHIATCSLTIYKLKSGILLSRSEVILWFDCCREFLSADGVNC